MIRKATLLFTATIVLLALTPAERQAQWKPVEMPFASAGLSPREIQLVDKLVEACRLLDDVYWRQSDLQGLQISRPPPTPPSNGFSSSWAAAGICSTRIAPLQARKPCPPATNYIRNDLTRAQIEQYVKATPGRQGRHLRSLHRRQTARRAADQAFRIARNTSSSSTPWRKALRDAAGLSPDPAFANFLRLRADALLTDDYYKSDLAWLDLKRPQVRRHLCPLRNLSGRSAGREDLLRRLRSDPQ